MPKEDSYLPLIYAQMRIGTAAYHQGSLLRYDDVVVLLAKLIDGEPCKSIVYTRSPLPPAPVLVKSPFNCPASSNLGLLY